MRLLDLQHGLLKRGSMECHNHRSTHLEHRADVVISPAEHDSPACRVIAIVIFRIARSPIDELCAIVF